MVFHNGNCYGNCRGTVRELYLAEVLGDWYRNCALTAWNAGGNGVDEVMVVFNVRVYVPPPVRSGCCCDEYEPMTTSFSQLKSMRMKSS